MNSNAQRRASPGLKYLQGYAPDTLAQVEQLIAQDRLGAWLQSRYPQAHEIRTDTALYDYVQSLRQDCLRSAAPLSKVMFDNKLQVLTHALGTHTTVSRVQGSKLKAKREIRIAALFKQVPLEFLRMITVHELAHLKERSHDKAFYQLCCYMEPRYHQLELELRMYLTHLELSSGAALWATPGKDLTGKLKPGAGV